MYVLTWQVIAQARTQCTSANQITNLTSVGTRPFLGAKPTETRDSLIVQFHRTWFCVFREGEITLNVLFSGTENKKKKQNLDWSLSKDRPCLRADVSYFLCCTRKTCNKGNRRRLHAGKDRPDWATLYRILCNIMTYVLHVLQVFLSLYGKIT